MHHGKKLNNKTLVVKYAESGLATPHGTPSSNVYIKGLPFSMTDEQLYTLFSPYGTIIKHKVLKDLNSGYEKFEFVHFPPALETFTQNFY
jgi:RNA recognition motif-containing protein